VCRVTEKSFNRQPFLAATDQVAKSSRLFNSRCEKSALYSLAVRMEWAAAPISPSTYSVTNRNEMYQLAFAIKLRKCWSAVFAQVDDSIQQALVRIPR
jgi:hypothetical protein